MSWQSGAGWLNENEWTAYPFTDLNGFSEQVADAQITVLDPSLEGWRLVVTAVSSSGITTMVARFEDAEQTVLDAASAVVTPYGAYEIWTLVSDHVEVLFVVKPFVGSWASVAWEVTADAVIYPNKKQLLSLSVYNPLTEETTEVAGPGEQFNLEAGDNTALGAEQDISEFRVLLSAVYNQAPPCSPGDWRSGGLLVNIGGASPNVRGEVRIEGGRNYAVMKTGANEVSIRNTSEACVDCDDYEELFLFVKDAHTIIHQAYEDFLESVDDANNYVLRIQSLMNTDIVGMEDGA